MRKIINLVFVGRMDSFNVQGWLLTVVRLV